MIWTPPGHPNRVFAQHILLTPRSWQQCLNHLEPSKSKMLFQPQLLSQCNSLLSFSRKNAPLFWSLCQAPVSPNGAFLKVIGWRVYFVASGEEAEACQVVGLPPGGLKHNGCQRYEAWKMPREYLYHFISCIMYNIYIICVYIRYIYIAQLNHFKKNHIMLYRLLFAQLNYVSLTIPIAIHDGKSKPFDSGIICKCQRLWDFPYDNVWQGRGANMDMSRF